MACDMHVCRVMYVEPPKCFKIIKKQLHKKYYVVSDIVSVENKILGYLGRYYYLKGRKIDSENPSRSCDVRFFLKIVPSDERQKNFIDKSGVFNTEIAIYKFVFPKMLLTDKFVPECILEMKDSFLVLQDMTSEGFQMLNKFVPLNLAYCKVVLETIGRFHAKSIIFEHKNQQNVLRFLQKKNIDLHSPDFLMQGAIITDIEGVSSIIDSIKDSDIEGWEKVKKKLREEAENYYMKLKSFDGKKVLCHSDLWSNNLLFKLDSDQNPIQCCLVDFQLARYAPPAVDILVFLFFTTSRKLRKEYFQTLIIFYYNSVAMTLKEEGLHIDNILPWIEFQKSIESLRFACMTAVLAYISIDLLESDTSKKGAVTPEKVWDHLSRNTAPLVLGQFKEVPHYRERIFDSLMELHELLA